MPKAALPLPQMDQINPARDWCLGEADVPLMLSSTVSCVHTDLLLMDLYPWESCRAREKPVAGSRDCSVPTAGAAGPTQGSDRQISFLAQHLAQSLALPELWEDSWVMWVCCCHGLFCEAFSRCRGWDVLGAGCRAQGSCRTRRSRG